MGKTYSEQKGKKPFNWFKELSAKRISDKKWETLKDLANDWVTCACGNECNVIPRESNGQPYDYILRKLGGCGGFYGAISTKNAKEALNILELIELRSAYLIQEINSK